MATVIRLHPADNVVVARRDLNPGAPIEASVQAVSEVPQGHKVASRALAAGEPIFRYGQVIGCAAAPIGAGEHVHTHNVVLGAACRAPAPCVGAHPIDWVRPTATFRGIVRPNGEVATRNYLGVISTVNCSATAARRIAHTLERELEGHTTIDGVVAITHTTGCGMASDGEGMAILRRTIAGYARHPNFAGVLLLGLGCEANQIVDLLRASGLEASERLATLTIQDAGGTSAAVRSGLDTLRAMVPLAELARRTEVPVSALTLALQCGGSDGYSGITANPALGACVDLLVRHGGSAVLSETPELYGAEHLLTARAATPEVAEQLLARLRWWEQYAARHGNTLDNNPSPGNKAGGLTTILEKSLGAVAKGGTSNLMAVVGYAERLTAKGLTFMDTPGYDPVSATGQVAGGANVMCFTTGRGSAFGCKPVPCLKLATNTALFQRMHDDMDLDCGPIADGGATVEEIGARIYAGVLDLASGQKSRSELLDYGEDEFAPWVLGAVL